MHSSISSQDSVAESEAQRAAHVAVPEDAGWVPNIVEGSLGELRASWAIGRAGAWDHQAPFGVGNKATLVVLLLYWVPGCTCLSRVKILKSSLWRLFDGAPSIIILMICK